jgi:hypothetical protein
MHRSHLTPGKDPVPTVQEAGWASGPVWTGVENLDPPGFNPRTVQPVGSRSKVKWTGHILRRNHLLKQVTELKIEVTGRRARRRKQILGDLR